jgi:hypothetical protein
MIQGNWQEAEAAFRSAMEADPGFYVRAGENRDRLGRLLEAEARKGQEGVDDVQATLAD